MEPTLRELGEADVDALQALLESHPGLGRGAVPAR
jgi:hypothetical protein